MSMGRERFGGEECRTRVYLFGQDNCRSVLFLLRSVQSTHIIRARTQRNKDASEQRNDPGYGEDFVSW